MSIVSNNPTYCIIIHGFVGNEPLKTAHGVQGAIDGNVILGKAPFSDHASVMGGYKE